MYVCILLVQLIKSDKYLQPDTVEIYFSFIRENNLSAMKLIPIISRVFEVNMELK